MLLLVVRIASASTLVHGYSGGLQNAGCICRSLRSFLVVGFFEIVFRLLRVIWILEIGSDSALSLTQSIVIEELDPLTRLIFFEESGNSAASYFGGVSPLLGGTIGPGSGALCPLWDWCRWRCFIYIYCRYK